MSHDNPQNPAIVKGSSLKLFAIVIAAFGILALAFYFGSYYVQSTRTFIQQHKAQQQATPAPAPVPAQDTAPPVPDTLFTRTCGADEWNAVLKDLTRAGTEDAAVIFKEAQGLACGPEVTQELFNENPLRRVDALNVFLRLRGKTEAITPQPVDMDITNDRLNILYKLLKRSVR